MFEYITIIQWKRSQAKFIDNRYSREHTWTFDGGVEVPASASSHIVPVPYSNPACVDPEEAFVASLSSCHMLWFLSIAAKNKFVIESYIDQAVGTMDKNEDGKLAITKVRLRPQVKFIKDNLPTEEQVEAMHKEAHDSCFLASSVKTVIIVEAIAP
ncbi:OsmC family protein [Nostoc sp. UHCC 0302]|uniref:OsmC family protein n=1 Tax=Nostoc sp. UHCC 0302 TaxID=3134896 RepID=UPI00311CB706